MKLVSTIITVSVKLQPSAAAQNGQPMASRSTHDQLMRKPITIEHHAQVKYIQNDEQSLVSVRIDPMFPQFVKL